MGLHGGPQDRTSGGIWRSTFLEEYPERVSVEGPKKYLEESSEKNCLISNEVFGDKISGRNS